MAPQSIVRAGQDSGNVLQDIVSGPILWYGAVELLRTNACAVFSMGQRQELVPTPNRQPRGRPLAAWRLRPRMLAPGRSW